MHVTVITRDGAVPATPPNALTVERGTHIVRI
jgi:hypothetical protein